MEYYFDILCLVTLYKDEKRYVEIYCQSPLKVTNNGIINAFITFILKSTVFPAI